MGHEQDRDYCLSKTIMLSPNVPKQLAFVVKGQKSKFYLPHMHKIKAIFDLALLHCQRKIN